MPKAAKGRGQGHVLHEAGHWAEVLQILIGGTTLLLTCLKILGVLLHLCDLTFLICKMKDCTFGYLPGTRGSGLTHRVSTGYGITSSLRADE